MRSEVEVDDYKATATARIVKCKKCNMGADPGCSCHEAARVALAAYEACVPRDFWDTLAKDITHNKGAFNDKVRRYIAKLNTALKRGYGLIFLGPNGVGKTTFMSFVLMEAIRAGRTAYYTTLPQLDHDLKRGFSDDEAQARLDMMLTSDFVAIDEVGKEHLKGEGSSFTKVQLERILKARFDDSLPVLLATNMGSEEVDNYYGKSLVSIFNGKYQQVLMMPGDQRANLRKKMESDMGYE